MKKLVALSMASSSLIMLAGCGSSSHNHDPKTPDVSATASPSESKDPKLKNNIQMPKQISTSASSPTPHLSSVTNPVPALEKQGGVSSQGISDSVKSKLATVASPTTKTSSPDTSRSTAENHVSNSGKPQSSVTKGSSSSQRSGSKGTASSSHAGNSTASTNAKTHGRYIPPRSYVAPKAVNAPAPKNSGTITSNAVYPRRLVINKIGMNKPIYTMGLTARGVLDPRPGIISWYNRSASPGKPGNSVILGHVTYNFIPDVFYNLPRVSVGDKITITYSNGATRTFTVYAKDSVNKNTLRSDRRVWGSTSTPTIVLATCDVNSRLNGYHRVNNYVVWAH